jgi:hypothetical protein
VAFNESLSALVSVCQLLGELNTSEPDLCFTDTIFRTVKDDCEFMYALECALALLVLYGGFSALHYSQRENAFLLVQLVYFDVVGLESA